MIATKRGENQRKKMETKEAWGIFRLNTRKTNISASGVWAGRLVAVETRGKVLMKLEICAHNTHKVIPKIKNKKWKQEAIIMLVDNKHPLLELWRRSWLQLSSTKAALLQSGCHVRSWQQASADTKWQNTTSSLPDPLWFRVFSYANTYIVTGNWRKAKTLPIRHFVWSLKVQIFEGFFWNYN